MGESDNESGGERGGGGGGGGGGCREQDRLLPIANVSRIMKKGLPANGKISKEAKETVQECVSEFISFITGEASDKCQKEKRKTINGDDLLWAMTTLGFEDYVEPLKIYLHKYREIEGDKTAIIGRPQHPADAAAAAAAGTGFYGHHAAGLPSSSSSSSSAMMMMMDNQQQQHQAHIYGSGNGSPSFGRPAY